MDANKFIIWKYNHDGPGYRSPQRVWGALGLLLAGGIGFTVAAPLGALLCFAALAVFFSTQKALYVGPRYLICGNRILYYANVRRLTYHEARGQLILSLIDGKDFLLESSRCTTNARKADKIARNQAKKFGQMSQRIIRRVLHHFPAVETVGITRELLP